MVGGGRGAGEPIAQGGGVRMPDEARTRKCTVCNAVLEEQYGTFVLAKATSQNSTPGGPIYTDEEQLEVRAFLCPRCGRYELTTVSIGGDTGGMAYRSFA